mgnify:CR=1 FL=1|jgi:hypothetical protein
MAMQVKLVILGEGKYNIIRQPQATLHKDQCFHG